MSSLKLIKLARRRADTRAYSAPPALMRPALGQSARGGSSRSSPRRVGRRRRGEAVELGTELRDHHRGDLVQAKYVVGLNRHQTALRGPTHLGGVQPLLGILHGRVAHLL